MAKKADSTPTLRKTRSDPDRRGQNLQPSPQESGCQLTPEERVRQEYLLVLTDEYGYSLDQIAEETPVAGRGSAQARADFLIWRTPDARQKQEHALIVIECKADNVTISLKDYEQGANYAQYEHARFFVTHNHRETKYWKVDDARRMPNYDEIANIPHADATDKEIEELLARLKVFKEDEFADLLHECHNVIRNREKLDPAAAFDEIAKILFVKVWVERDLRQKKQQGKSVYRRMARHAGGCKPAELALQADQGGLRGRQDFRGRRGNPPQARHGRDIVEKLQSLQPLRHQRGHQGHRLRALPGPHLPGRDRPVLHARAPSSSS